SLVVMALPSPYARALGIPPSKAERSCSDSSEVSIAARRRGHRKRSTVGRSSGETAQFLLDSLPGVSPRRPELVVLGRAVAEDRASALDHLAVPPAQHVDDVDVELRVRDLGGALVVAGPVADIARDVGGVVLADADRRRPRHVEAAAGERADLAHERDE